jgi:drug/metabolite transporter (DMT)-like permease
MKWLKWAIGEAGFRATSMTIMRLIGAVIIAVPQAAFSTMVIGIVQVAGGATMLHHVKKDVFSNIKEVRGAIIFGIFAFIGTMLPIIAYSHGANMPTYTLITLLAIIPGALVDTIFFRERFTPWNWLGFAIACVAGWLILKKPSLSGLTHMPMWMWLAGANALTLAVNQGISRSIKEIDVWRKNFWGGLATFVICAGTLLVFWGEFITFTAAPTFNHVLSLSGIISLCVIGMWAFNVIAYRDGAAIPLKQVTVNGLLLVLVTVIGFVGFGDTITHTQIAGGVVYLLAFVLINKESWIYLRNRLRK